MQRKIYLAERMLWIAMAGAILSSIVPSQYYSIQVIGWIIFLVGGINSTILQWQMGATTIFRSFVVVTIGAIFFALMYKRHIFFEGSEIQTEMYFLPLDNHGHTRYISLVQRNILETTWAIVVLSMISYYLGNLVLKAGKLLEEILPTWLSSIIVRLSAGR